MKSFKLSFIILIALLSNTYNSNASHLMGAQIWYKNLSKYKYEVHVDFYRDCRGIPMNSPTFSVRGITGCTSIMTPSFGRTSITDITPTCGKAGKLCYPANQTISGSSPAIEKHSYIDTIDFTSWVSSGCCVVQIGAGQCCRNGAITTGGAGNDFWTYCEISLCQVTNNSSPVFYSEPVVILKCNQPVYYNFAARDFINNDSLIYEMDRPLTGWSSYTSWTGSKSSTNPFTVYCKGSCSPATPKSFPPSGFYLDRFTGDMVFTPTDCSEVSIASVRITEYRKDSASGNYVKIGQINRDIQFIVMSASENTIPTIEGPDNIYFIDSSELSFEYKTSDAVVVPKTGSPILNDTVKITMSAFVPLQSTNASFTIKDGSKKQPTGIFKWKPMGLRNTKPYLLVLQASDNNCDYNAITHKSVSVWVRKKTELAWVEGMVYYDANKNCKRDSFEYFVPGAMVSADDGNSIAFQADSSGHFGGWLPAGSYKFGIKGKYSSFICTKSLTITAGKTYAMELGGLSSMKISGTVYSDTLKNCKADSLEPRFKNQFVYTEPGDYSSSTDSKGNWELKVPAGEYKILYYPKRSYNYVTCPTKPYTVSIYNDTIFKNMDMAIFDSAVTEVSASLITSQNYRRGYNSNVSVVVKNNGSTTLSSSNVWVKFNKKLKYVSSSSYISKTDTTIKFAISNLKKEEEFTFKLVLNADASTCSVNDTMTTRVWLDTTGLSKDILKTDNYGKQNIKIVAAVDPNIKEEHNTNGYACREVNKLRYFVQFQNTGTDTAVNITVIDTLCPALLAKTLIFNGASHPYEYSLNTNVLKVSFPKIYLVDTSVSKERSIGHFEFSIDIDPRINNELKFYNRADIYFDFAKPVKTNKQYITYTSYVKTGQTDRSTYCGADTIKVGYSSKFSFNSGNKFKVILSDKLGSFASGTKVLDSTTSTSVTGNFKVSIPSGISESSLYKIKIISTNPAVTTLDDAVSNSFTIMGALTKPTFAKLDTLQCGKDSIKLTINSSYSNFKIYDRKNLVSSAGNNKTPKIKPGLGKHYITVSASYQSCTVSSDTLKFFRDSFPVITLSSPSHPSLRVCENDSVTLKITGSNKFDLLGNSFAFIKSYSGTEAKIVISNTGDTRSAVFKGSTGCIDTSNILKFTRITNPKVTITSSDADLNICSNDSIVLTGGGAKTYQLFKNSSVFKSTFTSTIKPGGILNNDKFQIFGIDADGCKDSSDIIKFTVDTVPRVKVSCSDTNLIVCYNKSTDILFSGATTYNLYRNSTFWKALTSNPYSVSGINNNDELYVQGVTTKNCLGYSNKLKFKIITPVVTIKLNNTGLVCDKDSLCFSFTGGRTYQIFKNNILLATTSKQKFGSNGFANNDVVYVEGTDSVGCLAKSSPITLSLKPSPTIKLTNYDKDNSHCYGDNAVLTLSGGVTYNMHRNGGLWKTNITSPFVNKEINDKDKVYLIGVSTNGCSSVSDTLKFTVYAVPSIYVLNKSGNPICENDSVLLKFSGGVKYDLYYNKTLTNKLTDSLLYMKNINDGDEVYSIGYSIEGCKTTSNKLTLTVISKPTITITNPDTDNITCLGENVTINFTGGTTYELYKNNILWKTVTGNTTSFTNAANQDELYAIGGSGCSNTSNTIKLTVNTATITISNPDTSNTICDGKTATLNFSGGTKYDLYNNAGLLKANATSPFVLTNLKDKDEVFVIGTAANGCSNTSNKIKFTVHPLPDIKITNTDSDNSTCAGENVTINFSGGATYDLFKNNILFKSNTGTSYTFTATDKDEIYAQGVSSNGCENTSNKIKLTVWPIPAKPTITKTGLVLSSNYTTGNQWYEGATKLSGATSQNYSPVKTAMYLVEHTDIHGCLSPQSDPFNFALAISKIKLPGLKIYPNPATDYLSIETGEAGKYHISLIDVTGKLVKEETFVGNHFEWQIKPAKGIYHLKIVNEKGESETMAVEFK